MSSHSRSNPSFISEGNKNSKTESQTETETRVNVKVKDRPPIGYAEVRVFAHATEDPEKVLAAIRNTLPQEIAQDIVFQKSNLTGHHGNPIILYTTEITDKQALPQILKRFSENLSSLDKETLNDEIKLHVEKHNLFLRFDKQSAFLGQLKFSSVDPIHFKVHFKNKAADEIVEFCRQIGLLP